MDPKKRGKRTRQRIQYVKDKEGNKITNKHPDYEKHDGKSKNWSFMRGDVESDEEGKEIEHFLYNNSNRKKFKYDGPIWHHLKKRVPNHAILDENGDWVKTDMKTFKEALRKELQYMMTPDRKENFNRGIKGWAKDHLEVFIDEKI